MTYKLVCTDIDGTLLDIHKDVSIATIHAFNQVKNKNIPIILVSARMPKQMRHIQEKLGVKGCSMICYNGGLLLSGNTVIDSTEIPLSIVKKISAFNKTLENHLHLSLFYNDEWYAPQYDYWAKREENNTKASPEIKSNDDVLTDWTKRNIGAHKIMCMGDAEIADQMFTYLKKNFDEQLHIYRSKDTYIEIANKTISKLTGIEKLLAHDHPELTVANVVAYGDNYNDTEMIKAVGYGVAVANAREEVKAVAKAITASNIEDGVAKSLLQLFN
ncbi:HAD family hydrolase [Zhouia sp. PK063]|uniref:HAD family hydrolase n=1 Tax=Zhouia sp. PK063 TaxID=3373602 RepID=UPI0037A08772